MKNDYQIGDTKISIPPTLLFSVIGKIEDVRKAVTMDAKRAGDLVYVLGETNRELGGSEWYAMHGAVGNDVPKVDAAAREGALHGPSRAIRQGLVASCHDCSDGGLAVALAETAFAGGLGHGGRSGGRARGAGSPGTTRCSSPSPRAGSSSPCGRRSKAAFEAALAGSPFACVGTVTPRASSA